MTAIFHVVGRPATKGSTKSFALKKHGAYTGRVATTADNKRTKPWEREVRGAARDAGVVVAPFPVPVGVAFVFYVPRPRNHYGTGRNRERLRDDAPSFPVVWDRDDLDKLARCTIDGLAGVAYENDSQVVHFPHHAKRWSDDAGVPAGVRVILFRPSVAFVDAWTAELEDLVERGAVAT